MARAPERMLRLATATGGTWSPLDPKPEHVLIEEVASGLARCCRYGGQIREEIEIYSVAEHSVLMLDWAMKNGLIPGRDMPLSQEEGLAILFHDGAEAYLGDMVTPLKELIPEFRAIEDLSQAAVFEAFGVDPALAAELKPYIKNIDERIWLDEKEHLILEPALTEWKEDLWKDKPELQPLGVDIQALSYQDAKDSFFQAFVFCMEFLPKAGSERDPDVLCRNHNLALSRGYRPKLISDFTLDEPFGVEGSREVALQFS